MTDEKKSKLVEVVKMNLDSSLSEICLGVQGTEEWTNDDYRDIVTGALNAILKEFDGEDWKLKGNLK